MDPDQTAPLLIAHTTLLEISCRGSIMKGELEHHVETTPIYFAIFECLVQVLVCQDGSLYLHEGMA